MDVEKLDKKGETQSLREKHNCLQQNNIIVSWWVKRVKCSS